MRADWGKIEKSLENKVMAVFGRKLRDGKNDKVFCDVCDYDNGKSCFYEQLAVLGEVETKYPCGKAKAKYDALKSKRR